MSSYIRTAAQLRVGHRKDRQSTAQSRQRRSVSVPSLQTKDLTRLSLGPQVGGVCRPSRAPPSSQHLSNRQCSMRARTETEAVPNLEALGRERRYLLGSEAIARCNKTYVNHQPQKLSRTSVFNHHGRRSELLRKGARNSTMIVLDTRSLQVNALDSYM